jgi:hypothetical protein
MTKTYKLVNLKKVIFIMVELLLRITVITLPLFACYAYIYPFLSQYLTAWSSTVLVVDFYKAILGTFLIFINYIIQQEIQAFISVTIVRLALTKCGMQPDTNKLP